MKEDGVLGFFKGTLYRTPFIGFTGNLFFLGYEQSKNFYNKIF